MTSFLQLVRAGGRYSVGKMLLEGFLSDVEGREQESRKEMLILGYHNPCCCMHVHRVLQCESILQSQLTDLFFTSSLITSL